MDSKKPIVIITILVILVLGLGGFIIYDKFILEKQEEKQYTTVIDDVSIDINKVYKVGNILNTFDKAFSTSDTKYLGYIYNSKTISVKDFDTNAAIYTAIYNDLIRSNTEQTISNERVKNNYESIFGKTLSYKPSSVELGNNIMLDYDEGNNTYKYTASITNNEHKSEYLARNMKTTLKDDMVIISRKVFYVDYSNNKAIIYPDSSKNIKLGEIELKNGEVSLQEVTGKYGSKLKSFDFTFKLGSDDEYNFYKIERTK